MRVAVVQMRVLADEQENAKTAVSYIRKAALAGADLVVLPEMFCCPYETSRAEVVPDGPGGS